MAEATRLREVGTHADRPPRRHPELLPRQGSLWGRGSHQREYQKPVTERPRVQKPALPAPQGSAYGGYQNRIRRFQESRMKWASRQIPAQSPKKQPPMERTFAIIKPDAV